MPRMLYRILYGLLGSLWELLMYLADTVEDLGDRLHYRAVTYHLISWTDGSGDRKSVTWASPYTTLSETEVRYIIAESHLRLNETPSGLIADITYTAYKQ